jgi:chromate reductase
VPDDRPHPVSRRVLLVSGSLRSASSNAAALRTVAALGPYGVKCWMYEHLASLPPFNPDDDRDPLPPEVARLRGAIHDADAVLFSTPEYAGALPGSFKNLLDWTIGDSEPGSIYEKPVGWVNASPRDAAGAYAELRTVLGYAHARIVEAATAHIPVTAPMLGPDGLVQEAAGRAALRDALLGLVGSFSQ